MIEAVLVDDEEHALNLLELFLGKSGEVKTVGRYSNGFDALEAMHNQKPDVWFLDIEMPGMNGLDLAERIRSRDPEASIVYITAYDQYAIKAFEQAAIDYLLKPLEPDRLARTIARLKKEFDARPDSAQVEAAVAKEKLIIRLLGTFYAETSSGEAFKWRTSKEKELLVYLALQDGEPVHRDRIIDDLWPEDPYSKAKVYLHTCISLIRKHLKGMGLDRLVIYEKERYILDSTRVEVDALKLKEQLDNLKVDADSFDWNAAENTLSLYKGNLLQDEDYPWSLSESEKLEQAALKWLMTMAEGYIALGNGERAAKMAERIIHLSPCDEPAYRILMEAYMALGQHEQVHRVYKLLLDQLEEMHLQPSILTKAIYGNVTTGKNALMNYE